MNRRPTRRAFVILGIGVLLMIAGATAQAGWLFVLAAGVLGLVVGSFLLRHRLRAIEVERSVPYRSRVGDPVRVGLTIRNASTRPTPLLAVGDDLPAFEPVKVGVDRLDAGNSSTAELVLTASKRGRFTGGKVTIESGAPFGLIRSLRRFEVASEMLVVPDWVDLRSFPLVQPSTSPSDVSHERPRAGAGDEFMGVREFRPGDPLRAVHWRSTARAGNLIVREFEQETSSRSALVLAGGDVGDGQDSAFERLVSAAASIGLFAITTGHPIHLVTMDGGAIDHLPDASQNGLLDALASVQPADVSLESLVEAALGWIGRRGTVVVCTTDVGEAGASIDAAINRVERAGAHPVLVISRTTGGGRSTTAIPARVIEPGKELAACLA
jgi:uncharacterized protein (DUF58 family)